MRSSVFHQCHSYCRHRHDRKNMERILFTHNCGVDVQIMRNHGKLFPTASYIIGHEKPSRNLKYSQYSVIKTDSHSQNMQQEIIRYWVQEKHLLYLHRNIFCFKSYSHLSSLTPFTFSKWDGKEVTERTVNIAQFILPICGF